MKKIFCIASCLCLLLACQNYNGNQKTKDEISTDELDRYDQKEANNDFKQDSIEPPGTSTKVQSIKKEQKSFEAKQDWNKKIIKTANLSIEVNDHKKYATFLREQVRNVGGYISQEQQMQSESRLETNIVIKVPVDQFDELNADLSNDVVKLHEKNISSQDVTADFFDIRSRMEAKRQVRLQYLDLLKQAKDINGILQVQREVDAIQIEIEAANGRINYLSNSAAFSTINLKYFQVLNASAPIDSSPSFADKFATAFRTGWNGVMELLLGLVYVWPLVFFITLLWIVVKRVMVSKTKPIV